MSLHRPGPHRKEHVSRALLPASRDLLCADGPLGSGTQDVVLCVYMHIEIDRKIHGYRQIQIVWTDMDRHRQIEIDG